MNLKLTQTTNDMLRTNGAAGIPHPIPHQQQEQTVNVTQFAAPSYRKIALIGTAPSSRDLAPFHDPSWEIWACSPGNMNNTLPRVTVWFEIHGNMLWPENRHYGAPYLEWLKQQKFPIFMQDNSFIPNAIPLPKDELVREFGGDFFTSSFAWMMAMAIKAGAKEIGLFGIDMASRDEYILQRPGFYFFKYIAEQRGIKVTAPNESDIMQPPMLYGFSEVTPLGRKLCAREAELKNRVAPLKQQIENLVRQVTYLEGALEDIDYIKSIWGGAQSHLLIKPTEEVKPQPPQPAPFVAPVMSQPIPAMPLAAKVTKRGRPRKQQQPQA